MLGANAGVSGPVSGLPKVSPMVNSGVATVFGLPTPPPPVSSYQPNRQPGPLPQPPPPSNQPVPSPLLSMLGGSALLGGSDAGPSSNSGLYGQLPQLSVAPSGIPNMSGSLPHPPPSSSAPSPANGPATKRNQFGNLLTSGGPQPPTGPAMLGSGGPSSHGKGGFVGSGATGAMYGGDSAAGPLGSPAQLTAQLNSPAHLKMESAKTGHYGSKMNGTGTIRSRTIFIHIHWQFFDL